MARENFDRQAVNRRLAEWSARQTGEKGSSHAYPGTSAHKENRKDGSFEVIVGKSTTGDGVTTRFGLVSGYDTKPRRRLFEILQAQGLQMNQAITFLTDGGDTVRDLTEDHSPLAAHILDWFHIAMRLTVLSQMAKGIPVEHKGEKFEEELERVCEEAANEVKPTRCSSPAPDPTTSAR